MAEKSASSFWHGLCIMALQTRQYVMHAGLLHVLNGRLTVIVRDADVAYCRPSSKRYLMGWGGGSVLGPPARHSMMSTGSLAVTNRAAMLPSRRRSARFICWLYANMPGSCTQAAAKGGNPNVIHVQAVDLLVQSTTDTQTTPAPKYAVLT